MACASSSHPSLIPPRWSRWSWTQMKVKSRSSFSMNLHPSTKMIVFTSSLQCAEHSPLCFLTKKKMLWKISKYLHSYYWNYHFGGRMQIQWERWPRFRLHLGPWSSRSKRQDQGWMNMRRVREELALRIQNVACLHGMAQRNVASLS